MRAGQVWSEGQTIGERAIELSRAEAAVDEAEAVTGVPVAELARVPVLAETGTLASSATGVALVSDAVVPEGLMSERGPSLEESLRIGPPAASVEDAAQNVPANLTAPPGQVRPQPVEEETGRAPSALEPAPLLGWLSDMALSSAALGSLVVWHWRRAERNSPPLPARRWGLDLKRPFALEIEKLPQK